MKLRDRKVIEIPVLTLFVMFKMVNVCWFWYPTASKYFYPFGLFSEQGNFVADMHEDEIGHSFSWVDIEVTACRNTRLTIKLWFSPEKAINQYVHLDPTIRAIKPYIFGHKHDLRWVQKIGAVDNNTWSNAITNEVKQETRSQTSWMSGFTVEVKGQTRLHSDKCS